MALTNWLIDKSAYVRLAARSVQYPEFWDRQIYRGLVHVCAVTLLEFGMSARSGANHEQELQSPPISLMPVEYLTPAIENRALEVQRLLAYDGGKHRAPSIPDLLIAATAEIRGLTVLAVDKDFELIAEKTGQPVENPTRSPEPADRDRSNTPSRGSGGLVQFAGPPGGLAVEQDEDALQDE